MGIDIQAMNDACDKFKPTAEHWAIPEYRRQIFETYEAAKPPSPSVEGLISELEAEASRISENPLSPKLLFTDTIYRIIRQYFKGDEK